MGRRVPIGPSPNRDCTFRDPADRRSFGVVSAGKPGASGSEIGLTAWVGRNPFGERAAYLLLHPRDPETQRRLPQLGTDLGLLPVDQASDIPRVGTDHLFLLLGPHRFQLRSEETVLVEHVVSDDWIEAARDLRYVVLAIGRDPMEGEEFRGQVASYLEAKDRILAGLVNLA